MTNHPFPAISNPQITTTGYYSGDVIINLRNLFSDVDLSPLFESWRPIVKTQMVFRSGKLSLSDADQSNEIVIKVGDIADLDGNIDLTIPPITENDEFLMANHPQVMNNKVFGENNIIEDLVVTNITVGGTFDMNSNSMINAVLDGDLNTFQDIKNSSLVQITDKNKLHGQIMYKDAANILGDFDLTVRSGKLKVTNPANTFSYAFVGGAITAARNINIPLMASDGNLVVSNFANIFSLAQSIEVDSSAPFALYRINGTAGASCAINFFANNDAAAKKQFGQVNILNQTVTAGLEEGQFRVTLSRAGTVVTQLELLNSVLTIGASPTKLAFDPVGITTTRTMTFPNASGEVKINNLSIQQGKEGFCEFVHPTKLQGASILSPIQGYFDTLTLSQSLQGTAATLTSGTVSNSALGFAVLLANGVTRRSWNSYGYYRLGLPQLTGGNGAFFFGFTSRTTMLVSNNSPIGNTESGVMIGYRSFDTEWKVFSNDGTTGLTVTPLSPSIPVPSATTTYSMDIKMTATNVVCTVYNSGVSVLGTATITTPIPATTTNLNYLGILFNPTGTNLSITPTKLILRSDK